MNKRPYFKLTMRSEDPPARKGAVTSFNPEVDVYICPGTDEEERRTAIYMAACALVRAYTNLMEPLPPDQYLARLDGMLQSFCPGDEKERVTMVEAWLVAKHIKYINNDKNG